MKELMPELRFPEFEGEWEERFIEDVCEVTTGNKDTKDKDDDGVYDFFVRSDNVEKINTYSYDGEAILTSGDGVGVGKNFHYINGKFDYHQRVYCLHSFHNSLGRFVYYFFSTKFSQRVTRMSAKNSVDSVRRDMITKMPISIPILPEQTKIANFLSAVDEQISLLTEKQEKLQTYKRGVMQKLFSQELRFKDEHGADYPEWEEKEFEDVFTSVSTRKYQVNKSDYQDEGSFPIVDQGQRKVIGYSSESDKVYRNGEVIVFGDHTTILKYIDFDFIVGADGVKLLVSKGESNLRYLYYSLVVNNVQSEGYKRHFSILKEITLFIHSLPEQTKIADFLTAIDGQLEEVEAQIAHTKLFKQGLLQKMFV